MRVISYWAAAFSGLNMFAIGIVGTTVINADPINAIPILLEPTSLGPKIDTAYYITFMALGLWLVLSMFVRIPAAIALIMIMAKMFILNY
ncbi:hypothetical protein OU789_10750 [Halocynthiibacter sp. C4]|uniref:hypothetical protein n=1 Tax=Halocynthiibacter sp. C4 TaxID=2992758 RepID=UPI00237AB641|nr:hypothetical protein [Halocynthiibacter sp. C4]MDE0590405.1 hypothetical protein [Halocynthiibacter sp. C4]